MQYHTHAKFHNQDLDGAVFMTGKAFYLQAI